MELNEYLVKHIDDLKTKDAIPNDAVAAMYTYDRYRSFIVRGDFFTRFGNYMERGSRYVLYGSRAKSVKFSISKAHQALVGRRKTAYVLIDVMSVLEPTFNVRSQFEQHSKDCRDIKYFTKEEIKTQEREICKLLNLEDNPF